MEARPTAVYTWDPVPKRLTNPDCSVHFTIDFGHNVLEVLMKETLQYYATLPHIICLYIYIAGVGPILYCWTEETAGKGANEMLTCLWHAIQHYTSGAGHLYLTFDTGSHIWNQ